MPRPTTNRLLYNMPYNMTQPDRGIGKILIAAADKSGQLVGLNRAGQSIGKRGLKTTLGLWQNW